jgi:uncharacterized integral membrane protein
MRTLRRLLVLAVFVALLVLGWRFAAANLEPVRVHYLAGVVEAAPLWAALLVAFAIGFALAGLAGLYQMARLSLTSRRWRKVARGLEAELHQLRNLPLAASEPAPPRAAGPAADVLDPAPRSP